MNQCYDRRDFPTLTGATLTAAAFPDTPVRAQSSPNTLAQTTIPRWRGFNLLNFFQARSRGERCDGTVPEDDCRWIRDLGFNFIRIPMAYEDWHGHKLDRKLLDLLQTY